MHMYLCIVYVKLQQVMAACSEPRLLLKLPAGISQLLITHTHAQIHRYIHTYAKTIKTHTYRYNLHIHTHIIKIPLLYIFQYSFVVKSLSPTSPTANYYLSSRVESAPKQVRIVCCQRCGMQQVGHYNCCRSTSSCKQTNDSSCVIAFVLANLCYRHTLADI